MSNSSQSDSNDFPICRSFLKNVIHDLKNPLAAALGNIQVIRSSSSVELPSKFNKFLDNAILGCKKQLLILNSISDILKFKDGLVKLNPVIIDPVESISAELKLFSKFYINKKYHIESSDKSLKAYVDIKYFSRIIQSLLEHCSCQTREEGWISIFMEQDQSCDNCIIDITDDGEKITCDDVSLLFDPFCDPSLFPQTGRRDVGLMLAFSNTALEAMNGSIEVVENKTTGVKFRVVIPAVDPKSGA